MKDRKFTYRGYAYFDRSGIQKYLEKMALKGWMLKAMAENRWEFVRIEPQKLCFFVSYFKRNKTNDVSYEQRREAFIAYCRHSGWELAAQDAFRIIWYHASEDPVPIETDPESDLNTIHNWAKERFLLRYCVCVLLMLAWIGMLITKKSKMSLESALEGYFSLGLLLVPIGLNSIYELILYCLWRRKAKQAVMNNEDLPETMSWPLLGTAFQIALFVAECIYFAFVDNRSFFDGVMCVIGIKIVTNYISNLLRVNNT